MVFKEYGNTEVHAFFRGWWEGIYLAIDDPELGAKLLNSQCERVKGPMPEDMKEEMMAVAVNLTVEEDLESLGVE